jgi:hypothetical protein
MPKAIWTPHIIRARGLPSADACSEIAGHSARKTKDDEINVAAIKAGHLRNGITLIICNKTQVIDGEHVRKTAYLPLQASRY